MGHNRLVLHNKLVSLDQQVHSKQEHLNRLDNLDPQVRNRQGSQGRLAHSKVHRNRQVNRGQQGPNKQELLSKQAKLDLNRPISPGLVHLNKQANSGQQGPNNPRDNLDLPDLNKEQLLNKQGNKELLHLSRVVKQDLQGPSKLGSQDLPDLNRVANLAKLPLNRVASLGNQLLKANQADNQVDNQVDNQADNQADNHLVLEVLLPIQW